MAGRTVSKHTRVYAEGYDMSTYSKDVGELNWSFNVEELAALSDEVKNSLMGHANISPGTINAFLDNTATSSIHAVLSSGNGKRTVMIPIGDRAAPAEGDPVYAGQFEQLDYKAAVADGFVNASLNLGQWSDDASTRLYDKPWGTLLHENSAETAANTANSGLSSYKETASALGGFLVYQVFAGDGTATISVDDSADNSSWAALSGATAGELDCSSVQHGLVALGTTAAVRRYLRWQISLNTANTVTFALAFIRPE